MSHALAFAAFSEPTPKACPITATAAGAKPAEATMKTLSSESTIWLAAIAIVSGENTDSTLTGIANSKIFFGRRAALPPFPRGLFRRPELVVEMSVSPEGKNNHGVLSVPLEAVASVLIR